MERKYKYNIQNIIIGAERTGKTHFAKRFTDLVRDRTGKGVLFYNVGNPDDAEGYKEIELLDFDKTESLITDRDKRKAYKRNPKLLFFKYDGSIYRISKIGGFVNKIGKVCMYPVFDLELQRKFAEKLFEYGGGIQLIMDDARPIFRNGVNKEFSQLFGRKFHAGFKGNSLKGIDIHIMFHSFDEINDALFNYVTNFTVFRSNTEPQENDFKKSRELYFNLIEAFNYTKAADKYHHVQIFTRGFDKIISVNKNPIL